MRASVQMRILRVAAVLAMIGLAFMLWAVFVPTPMPVILAMSVGQGIGTLSFALYLFVVVSDLHRARAFEPPPEEHAT